MLWLTLYWFLRPYYLLMIVKLGHPLKVISCPTPHTGIICHGSEHSCLGESDLHLLLFLTFERLSGALGLLVLFGLFVFVGFLVVAVIATTTASLIVFLLVASRSRPSSITLSALVPMAPTAGAAPAAGGMIRLFSMMSGALRTSFYTYILLNYLLALITAVVGFMVSFWHLFINYNFKLFNGIFTKSTKLLQRFKPNSGFKT